MDDDVRNLDLLATFHYVVGGICALIGCFPIIHLIIGIGVLAGGMQDDRGNGPPALFGVFFVGIALMMMAMFWSFAVALLLAGRRLNARTHYTFCLVVAAIACTFFPFGTVLGVLTIIVLMRPSVRVMFGVQNSPSPASASRTYV